MKVMHVLGRAGVAFCLAGTVAFGLGACAQAPTNSQDAPAESSESKPATVTIKSHNGAKEVVDLEVPFDAQRVAVMDLASLDILDRLGVGDRVVGASKTSLDYLAAYSGGDIANLGTIKEADLEAVAACQPDVIFIGGRLAKSYDELSKIAPVVFLSTDANLGVIESTKANATTIASMFGKEDKVAELMSGFDARAAKLTEAAAGRTAIVGLYTNGGFNVLGNDGRCSLIGREAGFTNLAASEVTSTHGNEASFESLVEQDPDFIFVLNRDAAIGKGSDEGVRDVVENELTQATKAYRDGHIVYLAHPGVWYTAEGGITALDVMLSDIETAVGISS